MKSGSTVKVCILCNKRISVKLFYRQERMGDSLHSYCIPCHKEYRKVCYLKNREKALEKNKEYHLRHTKKIKAYKKEYNKAYREKKKLEKAAKLKK